MVKDFEPYRNLWITCSDWLKWYDMWMNDPISSIDAENIDRNVTESYKAMHKAIKQFQDYESKSCCVYRGAKNGSKLALKNFALILKKFTATFLAMTRNYVKL